MLETVLPPVITIHFLDTTLVQQLLMHSLIHLLDLVLVVRQTVGLIQILLLDMTPAEIMVMDIKIHLLELMLVHLMKLGTTFL